MKSKINSRDREIAELCRAFDRLDDRNGDRPRGPLPGISRKMRRIEGRIMASSCVAPDVVAWKVRRLERAVANEWSEAEIVLIRVSLGGANGLCELP